MTGPTAPGTFDTVEYLARLARAQSALNAEGIDALLLTGDADIRYFSGFLTRFWESPTRPWYLIVPATGLPTAVIPQIGVDLMARTWITDIRPWPAPHPTEDGTALLADALRPHSRVATPMETGTHLRAPLAEWATLNGRLPNPVRSDGGLMRRLRQIKSPAEVARIEATCTGAARAFTRLPGAIAAGDPLSTVFRRFQILLLEEGADWVPYLAGAASPGGYADVISPADGRRLTEGDVLMLDTGAIRDGYFCDFNRNFCVGQPDGALRDDHARLIDATHAGFDALRPGQTAEAVFATMDKILTGGATTTGRYGHGLGLHLTEPPSLMRGDTTVLEPGMVLTLEPVLERRPGVTLVHEENVVITETGARWLTPPAGPDLTVIPA